jgi:hypothetical protein
MSTYFQARMVTFQLRSRMATAVSLQLGVSVCRGGACTAKATEARAPFGVRL